MATIFTSTLFYKVVKQTDVEYVRCYLPIGTFNSGFICEKSGNDQRKSIIVKY